MRFASEQVPQVRTTACGQHRLQTKRPHCLQWCRRRRNVKREPQTRHDGEVPSGSQYRALSVAIHGLIAKEVRCEEVLCTMHSQAICELLLI